jgi:hypothetical protein
VTDREAMQQALDALELLARYENPATKVQVRKPRNGGPIVTMYPHKVATEAAAPLRERLAQPEREPVCAHGITKCSFCHVEYKQPEKEPVAWIWKDGTVTTDPDRADGTWTPLYTTPPQRKPLTDKRITQVIDSMPNKFAGFMVDWDLYEFTRAIEAAHGIKGEA